MTGQREMALGDAALRPDERRIVERLVARLQEELGEDLLAIVAPARDFRQVGWWALPMVEEEADPVGDSPVYYSLRVFDTEWLRDRRNIRSFFVEEVDRDKIVLHGGRLDDTPVRREGETAA